MRFPPLFFWNCDTPYFYPGGLMFSSMTGLVRLRPLLRAAKKKRSFEEISPKQCQQHFGKQKIISSHRIPDLRRHVLTAKRSRKRRSVRSG
jgi:hypothetical protein